MDMNMNENMKSMLLIFILILLPLILILLGAVAGLLNGVFYILTISWFGMGMIFYGAIERNK